MRKGTKESRSHARVILLNQATTMPHLRGLTGCVTPLDTFIEVSGTTWFPTRLWVDAEVHLGLFLDSCHVPNPALLQRKMILFPSPWQAVWSVRVTSGAVLFSDTQASFIY